MIAEETLASARRMGRVGAWLVIIGTLLSGPLAILAVSLVQRQPPWVDAPTFVAHFHPIQSVTFFFGLMLMAGSVLMIAAIYALDGRRIAGLLALTFTGIGAGMIFFNYSTQASLIPALVRHYEPALDPVISLFVSTNPISLFWVIEMWGYGFLGVGTWLAAGYFRGPGIERTGRYLFLANGVLSVIGALWTAIQLEWVLTTAGLAAFAVWNILYVMLAAAFLLVLRQRPTLA